MTSTNILQDKEIKLWVSCSDSKNLKESWILFLVVSRAPVYRVLFRLKQNFRNFHHLWSCYKLKYLLTKFFFRHFFPFLCLFCFFWVLLNLHWTYSNVCSITKNVILSNGYQWDYSFQDDRWIFSKLHVHQMFFPIFCSWFIFLAEIKNNSTKFDAPCTMNCLNSKMKNCEYAHDDNALVNRDAHNQHKLKNNTTILK